MVVLGLTFLVFPQLDSDVSFRMENSVLGNALEGVPEESEEEEQQPNNPNIESANNLDGQCKNYSTPVTFFPFVKN